MQVKCRISMKIFNENVSKHIYYTDNLFYTNVGMKTNTNFETLEFIDVSIKIYRCVIIPKVEMHFVQIKFIKNFTLLK